MARSEDREIRADAGFALPAIYEYCEDEGIYYTIGLVPNPRLEDSAAPLVVFLGDAHLDALRMRHGMAANKVRLLSSEVGYEAGSRGKKRRVVYKAEVLEEGTNTRFVVTNRLEEAPLERALRALRPERRNGESHKGLQKRIAGGDRLSCGKFWANQFRLLLHAAAYWLLDVLRERLLVRRDIRRMQLDTLRLRVVKIGGVGYASC